MRGLRWLAGGEGFASSAQVLVMTTPLVLFLDELGFSKSELGLVSSLVHLAGPLALIIAPTVERFGLKRTYVLFLGTRNIVMCGMILLPWIIPGLGFDVAVMYTAAVMGSFGLLRVVAETAFYPWMLEAIPNSVRGKYTAVSSMVATAARLLAVLGSGYVIGQHTGLWRYQTLIAIGCCCGLVSVLIRLKVPGGEPRRERQSRVFQIQQLKDAVSDRNLMRYVAGMCLLILATHSWGTFAPLYLKDVVGLSQAEVVLLQTGTMVGGFTFSFLWGYAADRYGSKPVLVAGVVLIIGVPVGWLAMPVHSAWSLYWAVTIALMSGVGEVAWNIGHMRLLYVSLVPPAKRMAYTATYYAIVEVTRFAGPLAAGLFLDYLQSPGGGMGSSIPGIEGPYQIYFAVGLVLLALSLQFLLRIRSASADGDSEDGRRPETQVGP